MAKVKRVNKPLAVKRFMEGSPFAQALVLAAIAEYATGQLAAPDWKGTSIIHQNEWRKIAQEALDVICIDE